MNDIILQILAIGRNILVVQDADDSKFSIFIYEKFEVFEGGSVPINYNEVVGWDITEFIITNRIGFQNNLSNFKSQLEVKLLPERKMRVQISMHHKWKTYRKV